MHLIKKYFDSKLKERLIFLFESKDFKSWKGQFDFVLLNKIKSNAEFDAKQFINRAFINKFLLSPIAKSYLNKKVMQGDCYQ